MKNQYFGDNRDLFKYGLILQVIQQIGSVKHFTFIPMLTEDDSTKQGSETNRHKAKAGTENKELKNFLDKCVREHGRNIKQLESFFGKSAIKMTIFEKDEYFSHKQRRKYFEQIGNELLSKSLVCIDPDIGLEVKRSRDKHILYSEVRNLYESVDIHSILMIFQFIPRVNRETYFREISKKLKEKVGNLPVYISDSQIVFFFLTKDKSLRKSLSKVISDYGKCYRLRVGNA